MTPSGGRWERLLPHEVKPPEHTCSRPELTGDEGHGSVWVCDCGCRWVLNRAGETPIWQAIAVTPVEGLYDIAPRVRHPQGCPGHALPGCTICEEAP